MRRRRESRYLSNMPVLGMFGKKLSLKRLLILRRLAAMALGPNRPFMRVIAPVVAPPGAHLDLYLADLQTALR
jgi:hypothetical protein